MSDRKLIELPNGDHIRTDIIRAIRVMPGNIYPGGLVTLPALAIDYDPDRQLTIDFMKIEDAYAARDELVKRMRHEKPAGEREV